MDPAALVQQQQVQQYIAQQVQAQVAAALQQAPQAAAAPAPARGAPAPRAPQLALYDGRASTLDDWLSKLEQQFDWYGYDASHDADRIRFAAVNLTGAALDWWRHLAARPTTWAALATALRARFQPVTTADSARARMHALVQGRSPAHDYVSAFRRLLVAVPDMSEADRVFLFLRGLQPAIATQLRVHGVTTLDAAVAMAVRIGSLRDMHPAGAAPSPFSPTSSDAMDVNALLDGVEGLEQETDTDAPGELGDAPVTRAEFQQLLNAMRDERRAGAAGRGAGSGGSRGRPQPRGLPRIAHLTPQQVSEHMEAGKCFGCGSKEHQSRQCPRRKIGADGKVSWTN